MIANGLAVPSGHSRQAMGDVFDLDVERRGVEEIKPAAGQHSLPGPRRFGAKLLMHLNGHRAVPLL